MTPLQTAPTDAQCKALGSIVRSEILARRLPNTYEFLRDFACSFAIRLAMREAVEKAIAEAQR